MSLRPLLACVLVAATASGCIRILKPGEDPFADDDCRSQRLQNDPTSREARVAAFVCRGRKGSENGLVERHKTFDDRRPDLVTAAFVVIECGMGACDRAPAAVGISAYYADLVKDEAALRAAVQPLALSDRTKDSFVRDTTEAVSSVKSYVDALDARQRHVYVDAPQAVVARRRAYFRDHAALYARLDAAEKQAKAARAARKEDPAVVGELRALRSEYVAGCASSECRFDPFVIELTRELVLLGVAADDELFARAEGGLLSEPGANRHQFAVETYNALFQATAEEQRAFEKYEAVKGTLDATTLQARFGKTPPQHAPLDGVYVPSERLPDLLGAFERKEGEPEKVVQTSGVVKSVADASKTSAHGEPLSTVSFRDNLSQEGIESCVQTGRVKGVSWDSDNHAHLEYEEVCQTVGTKTNVEHVASILVPTAEAKSLRPGDLLYAVVTSEGREGYVDEATAQRDPDAKKAPPVLQLRGDRFPHP